MRTAITLSAMIIAASINLEYVGARSNGLVLLAVLMFAWDALDYFITK